MNTRYIPEIRDKSTSFPFLLRVHVSNNALIQQFVNFGFNRLDWRENKIIITSILARVFMRYFRKNAFLLFYVKARSTVH